MGKAILFDSPWNDTLTEVLYRWVTDSMGLEITAFVPNHWHEDCMGGLGFLRQQGVKSYASKMTIEIAKSKNLPIPEQGFTDSLHLQLGDMIVSCYYPGAAHSSDNIVVWIPSDSILFAGCMIKSTDSRDLGNITDGDPASYPCTIAKLAKKFRVVKTVVPGHGAYGGFELITHTLRLVTQ